MKTKLTAFPLLCFLGLLNFHLTVSAQPVAKTLAASSVTSTNATLNGTVTTGNLNTTVYFQYGLTTKYGSSSATNILAATNTALLVSNLISHLSPVTTYHFQLVASNSAGTALGGDIAFTTPHIPPVVMTLPATSITTTSATLNGTVNPNGEATTAYFQFGLTTNYGDIGGFTYLPATNNTLTLPGFVASIAGSAGANWTDLSVRGGGENWQSIASSGDGRVLLATYWTFDVLHVNARSYSFFVSTNSGLTWNSPLYYSNNANAFLGNSGWAVASSADGTRLAAAEAGGGIYISLDSGATWKQTSASNLNWQSIASSADGTRLVAGVAGGGIYISSVSGGPWTKTSAPNYLTWEAVASSADGERLAAAALNGIWTSTDGGATWIQSLNGELSWGSIASSADGMRLVAGGAANSPSGESAVWTSADGGATWQQSLHGYTQSTLGYTFDVASSVDGTHLEAVESTGGTNIGLIYASTDGGATWSETGAPSAPYTCIASSADGTKLTAGVYDGDLYISSGASNSLALGTTYHYRLVGITDDATSLGSDLTFTTPYLPPTVKTLAATSVTATNATLKGTVDPNGGRTTAYFVYGLTTNYGSIIGQTDLAATNSTLTVSSLLSSLLPGTTYHFELVATDNNGQSYNLGGDFTFTTPVLPPTVKTLAATSVAATNVTLNGTVNPNGAGTTAYFRYGLTTNYGSFSATNSLAATNATLSVLNLISGLTPGTTYHFQLVAANSAGTSLGVDLAFTTVAPPVATTLPAASVTATNATLNGTVNPGHGVTTAYFKYGVTTNYGSVSATTSLAATSTTLAVSNLISSLLPGTTYHFELVANNSAGTAPGGDMTFTTPVLPPTVKTLAATSVAATNVTLNGTVNPNGAGTTAYFRYGLTTNYGSFSATNSLAATNATLSVLNLISGLTPGTTYHFQLVAANSAGTSLGVDLAFTTVAPPVATTLPAASVTATNATLNGTVNPGHGVTTAYFKYGVTTNYGSVSATTSLAATNTTLSVSDLIRSLLPGTTYHFQLVASNSGGTTLGGDLTLTTPNVIISKNASSPPPLPHPAASITQTKASLNGTLRTGGLNLNLHGSFNASGGAWQLSFTNVSGLSFTVLGSTNFGLPLSNWTVLGAASEASPGQYQFTDPLTANSATRFYRIRSP